MPTVRIVPLAEAQQTRKQKTPGIRAQRMAEFTGYAQALLDNPGEAVVYEGIEESPQKFVLSLRGAFRRLGQHGVIVRKLRGRDEVRAWVPDPAAPVEEKPKRARKPRKERAAA